MTEATELPVESRVEQIPGQLAFDDLMPQPRERLRAFWQKSRGFISKVALAGSIGFGVGAGVATHMFPETVEAGPHEAVATPNPSSQFTIDLGPGDKLTRPSGELYGATLTIKGLKGDNSSEDSAVLQDIETYANLFNVDKISSDAASAIKSRAIEGGLWTGALSMALFSAAYASYGTRRRQELHEGYMKHRGKIIPATCAAGMALGTTAATLVWAGNDARSAKASQELDGTPLEGWTAHSSLVRTGIGEFMNLLERNEHTAQDYRDSLKAESEITPLLKADKNSFTMVVVGNLKCNMVLPPSIGEVIDQSDATYFMAAGDLVFSGSSYENTCISSLAHYIKQAKRVVAPGNHASETSEKKMRDEDFTELNREVETIAGRTFFGDDSPRRSPFGNRTYQERNETETEMGEKLADKACRQKEPLFAIMFNEPNAAEPSAEQGCATLVIAAGEESLLVEKTRVDGERSWYFIAGDATGTEAGNINVGEPQEIAQVSILKLDKDTKQVTAEQTISFYPDKERSVKIPQPLLFYDETSFAHVS